MSAVIETDALTKLYRGGAGIRDLTLTVDRGEVFGFLGPNGAGKTTTIRTLLDLLHPTSGNATIFGLDTRRCSREIRARVGNLPGDFAYEDRLTGEQLLRLFARLRGTNDLTGARSLAERFKADLNRPLRQLSRGNRQKIGIIQALFHNPELLILDEPTTGLDPLMQEEFLQLIAERREQGTTVFLSSHDLPEVERACDRVGIIRAGRLAAIESVDEMRARAYRKVTLKLREPADPAEFAAIEGVDSLERDGDEITFRALGPLDEVIAAVARHQVADLEITKPSLEELFLLYYDGTAGP
ncbi:MAG: ABC transporter ATP-binding protein [Actinomycetes bacterium]